MPFKYKEDKAKYFSEWRRQNLESGRLRMAKWAIENPHKRMWKAARDRAVKHGLEFNIDVEDIIIPEFCPYLGIKLIPYTSRKEKNLERQNIMSLDRIDSSKGYIKGNIEVISFLANIMKSNATKDQLIAFSLEVLKRYANLDLRH